MSQAAPHFPSETVHLVVVDPGVGTSRRAILVEANRQLFVAPDNGVLSLVLQNCSHYRVRELTNRALWLFSPSSTFHGRDIFAPVAAALASGKAHPEDVGPVLEEVVFLPDLEPLSLGERSYKGIVLSVDRFGNVITNFSIERYLLSLRAGVRLLAGSTVVDALQKTFADARPGEIFVFPGSSGFLEIGMNQGSAAHVLGLAAGQSIQLNTPV